MDEKTLRLLIATLNKITVNGKENMAMLMGCITVLEKELAKRREETTDEQDTPVE